MQTMIANKSLLFPTQLIISVYLTFRNWKSHSKQTINSLSFQLPVTTLFCNSVSSLQQL